MGVIAAGTQFYSGFNISASLSRRYAKWTLTVILSLLLILMFLHRRFVKTVHFSEQQVVSYIIGSERTENCPCAKRMSDAACIRTRNANPDNIEDCWLKEEISSREFSLSLVYILLTGSFAYFIGLLLIRESVADKKRPGLANKPKPKAKKAVPKTQGG
jgi:hypothetical protein